MAGLFSGPVCLVFCEPLCLPLIWDSSPSSVPPNYRFALYMLSQISCMFHWSILKNSHPLDVNNSLHLPCLQAPMDCLPHDPFCHWGFIWSVIFGHFRLYFSLNFSLLNSIFISLFIFPYCLCFHEIQSIYPYPISIHSGGFFHDLFKFFELLEHVYSCFVFCFEFFISNFI